MKSKVIVYIFVQLVLSSSLFAQDSFSAYTPTDLGGELALHHAKILAELYGAECADWATVVRQLRGGSDLTQGAPGKNFAKTIGFMGDLKVANCEGANDKSILCLRTLDLKFGKIFRDLLATNHCQISSRWPLKVAGISCKNLARNYDVPEKEKANASTTTCRYLLGSCGESSLEKEGAEFGLRCQRDKETETCLDPSKKDDIVQCKLADNNGFYKMGYSRGFGPLRLTTEKPQVYKIGIEPSTDGGSN